MHFRFLIAGLLLFAAPVTVSDASAQDATNYVQKLVGEMVAVSKQPTRERRAFYEKLLSEEIDWSMPATRVLGQRFAGLPEDDQRKLSHWARDALLSYESAMRFIQNLIFQSCAVSGRQREGGDSASMHINCKRFGGDPNFIVRFDVQTRPKGYQIVDIGYIGISLIEELSKEIFKEDAVQKHGIRRETLASN